MTIEYTIDAFLDGETVEPAALDAALAAAEGRAYLIDALAIRQLVSDAPVAAAPARRRPALLFSARAAVLAVGLVGLGYAAGTLSTTPGESSSHRVQRRASRHPHRRASSNSSPA